MDYLKVKVTERSGASLNQRRELMALLTFMIIALSLITACGDDDIDREELVGTWKAISNIIYYGSISNPDSTEVVKTFGSDVQTIITFRDDNTFTKDIVSFGETQSISGPWSVSGNKLTFGNTGNPKDTIEYSISDNKLTLSTSETIGSYTTFEEIVFIKL